MDSEKLSKNLSRLKKEISRLEASDADSAARLNELVEDIEDSASENNAQRIQSTIEQLEEQHPAVTEILNRIATILSNMGV